MPYQELDPVQEAFKQKLWELEGKLLKARQYIPSDAYYHLQQTPVGQEYERRWQLAKGHADDPNVGTNESEFHAVEISADTFLELIKQFEQEFNPKS